MPNSWFRLQRFTVKQDRCAMKVSTDGILLGAWTKYEGAKRILDIGTGTGLLALIAAQRNERAHIDAVELDLEAAIQARENVADSPWPEQITVHQADIRTWRSAIPYDLVLCNPPFYKGHTVSSEGRMAVAKHDAMLSLVELLHAMARLTKGYAHISMIFPADRLTELEVIAESGGFYPCRKCLVHYRSGKPVKRVLVELSRNPGEAAMEEMSVASEAAEPSPEFRALVHDLEVDP